MVKIWEKFAQNMVHKLVLKWERFAQQKSWEKYGPKVGPILPKTWRIKWEMFFEYLWNRHLCRKMETVYAENRLQRRKTGFVQWNRAQILYTILITGVAK